MLSQFHEWTHVGCCSRQCPVLQHRGGRVGVCNNDGDHAGSALQDKGKILAILIKTWLVNTQSRAAFLYKAFARF